MLSKDGNDPEHTEPVEGLPAQNVRDHLEADRLFTTHYDELCRVARASRARRPKSNTLLTGDLLHEGFLRMRQGGDWVDDRHFLRSAAIAMRHVMIDRARARMSRKRDRSVTIEMGDDVAKLATEMPKPEITLTVAKLIKGLEETDPRLARVVDCRFFAGYTSEETADILGLTVRTVSRDWSRARAWLVAQAAPGTS